MDFHPWAVLLTVMCRHLVLFSNLYWHGEFVNTGKKDRSLFSQWNRKSYRLQVWLPSLNIDCGDGRQTGGHSGKTKGEASHNQGIIIETMNNIVTPYISVGVTWGETWLETQHTWGGMMKWAVAMVIRHYSITELQGNENVSFSLATTQECQR